MPIDKISDIRRFPRLNKIRMGIKKEGQKGPYPSPTDYFVCPEEVTAYYGERPTELDIMFPSDDLDLIAPQWYKCYSYSQGLICKGDGKKCRRKVDADTGDFANKDTLKWDMAEGLCDPEHCPKIGDKQCRKVMSLMFILPEIPGLGVYQLDTSSFHSIVNMNSQLAVDGFIRPFTHGKIAFIPLKLSIGPQEVTPPGVGRKTVQILKLRADVKLADIIRISRQAPAQVLLPTLEEETPPEDLYPDEVIAGDLALPDEETTTPDQEEPKVTPLSNACYCQKPVPSGEVTEDQGFCSHRTCGGYICTPPIDCFPGCPHMPLEGTVIIATRDLEAPPDTGIPIDLEWLHETLKLLRWTEDTAKGFLASHYQVEVSGTLNGVLQRLNRSQAEEFTKELNNRAAKVRPVAR